MTEARNYHGFDPDGDANTEADHFGNCSAGPTLIEIGEGAEPPARDGMRKGALAKEQPAQPWRDEYFLRHFS